MTKLLTFMLFLLLLFQGTIAQTQKVTVNGTITGLNGRELILLDADKSEIVRTHANNNDFSINAQVVIGDGREYMLYIPDLGPLGPSIHIPFICIFIDTPSIEIKANISDGNLELEQIKGSPAKDEYGLLHKRNIAKGRYDSLALEYNKIFSLYHEEPIEENSQKLHRISNTIDSLEICIKEEFINMISENKTSKVLAAIILPHLSMEDSIENIQKIVNAFDKSIHNCYPLSVLQKKIEKIQSIEIGKPAPDFTLTDSNGNKMTLSSMRGKYVLIDFWASWCGPCISELPNIKKVYAKFKDRGLEVIGISIDNNEKLWRQALQREQLPYLQLYDPKWTTQKLYNFAGIPFVVLISPEGIILEKGLWGENVRTKIAEYIQ